MGASRTRRHFSCTRAVPSTTSWCRPSWPASRATWICISWIGRAEARRACRRREPACRGLAVFAHQFLELLLEVAQHTLVAFGFLVGQKTDGHAFHDIAAQIEAEKKFFALALPFGKQIQAGGVELAFEGFLRGEQDGGQLLVGARGHGEFEEGDEPRMLDVSPV